MYSVWFTPKGSVDAQYVFASFERKTEADKIADALVEENLVAWAWVE